MDGVQFDAVVLDVGGVLLLPAAERVGAALGPLAPSLVVDQRTVRRAHYRGVAVPASDAHEHRGDHWPIRLDRYVDCYVTELGIPPRGAEPARDALAALFQGVSHGLWSVVEEEARSSLEDLHRLGVPLAVVSNADGSIARQLHDAGVCQVGPGPGVPVVTVVDSGDVGVAKPDPAIFGHALAALGVPADRALYVGDTPAVDLVGAEAAGMPAVIVDPYGFVDLPPAQRVDSLRTVAARLAADMGVRPSGVHGRP